MATIQLGKIKQVWRDAWSNGNNYAVDDLVSHVDQNITSTYIAIQASTSGSPQAPSTGGTINTSYWNLVAKGVADPVPAQNTHGGKFLTTNGTTASWGTVTQVIKKIHSFDYATRTGGSGSANNNQFTWTSSFTPLDTSNNFYFSGQIPINHAGNDYCGFGLRIEKSGGGTTDLDADGVIYASSNNGNMGLYGYQINYTGSFNGAGTYTIFHRTFGSSSHPDFYCPNSNDDNRLTSQTSGNLQIIEYANT
tara:strand:- start:401 stop:1150 length:750 start_codon:yes stop_codon:yes gene_type:complete